MVMLDDEPLDASQLGCIASAARHDLRPGRDASRASAECACSAVLRLVWDDPASQPSSAAVDVQARHEACHRH
jgi:hypothetical protein